MKILKWIPRILLMALVVWIATGIINYYLTRPSKPPEPPYYAIQTYSNDEFKVPSRIYFTKEFSYNDDGIPVAKGYWDYDGKDYHKHNSSIEFPQDIYGNIEVVRRE